MIELGYKLSSEEFGPADLVRLAARAEDAGFDFALVSDHFHPWTDAQGESPFVWTVLGALAGATSRLRIGTAVTCPTIRVHPAIVAQAAATTAALMGGRFFLGVGSGENLNEHVVGRGWPPPAMRLEMFEEAIEVIRLLWEGGTKSHRGRHYTLEDACLYTRPETPPQLMIAASKPLAAELAGRKGDAMINTEVDAGLVRRFDASGGAGKPRFVELGVCWAADETRARKTARELWALAALKGALFTDLRRPADFAAAFAMVSEDQVAEAVVCGPDPARHVDAIRKAERAGYTNVCIHQIGREQEGFIDFYQREVMPALAGGRTAPRRRPAGRAAKAASRTPGRARASR